MLTMNKIERRVVVKYLHIKGLKTKAIYDDMKSTLGDGPGYSTVRKWVAEFKHGKKTVEDDPRSGRPITATTPENIKKIYSMVNTDQTITVNAIVEATGISRDRVQNILTNELRLFKVSGLWITQLLPTDQLAITLTD